MKTAACNAQFNTQLMQRPKQYTAHCAYVTIAEFHEALQHNIAHCPHDT